MPERERDEQDSETDREKVRKQAWRLAIDVSCSLFCEIEEEEIRARFNQQT